MSSFRGRQHSPTSSDEEIGAPKKKAFLSNWRLTLEQAIKSKDSNFTDYNPFQSDDSDGQEDKLPSAKTDRSKSISKNERRKTFAATSSQPSVPSNPDLPRSENRPNKGRASLPLSPLTRKEFAFTGSSATPSPRKGRVSLPLSSIAKLKFAFPSPGIASTPSPKSSPTSFHADPTATGADISKQIKTPLQAQTPLGNKQMYPSMPILFDARSTETASLFSTQKKDSQPHLDATYPSPPHDLKLEQLNDFAQADHSATKEPMHEDKIPAQDVSLVNKMAETGEGKGSNEPDSVALGANHGHPTRSATPNLLKVGLQSSGSPIPNPGVSLSVSKLSDSQSKCPSKPRVPTQRIKLSELTCTPTPAKKTALKQTPQPAQYKIDKSFTSVILDTVIPLMKISAISFVLFGLFWYSKRVEKFGYCDNQSTSNSITRDQQINNHLNVNRGPSLKPATFSPRDIFQTIHKQTENLITSLEFLNSCQPCPDYSICSRGRIARCQTDFIKEQPAHWRKTMSFLIPRFLQPTCIPKSAELKEVLELSNEIERILKNDRDRMLCAMSFKKLYFHKKFGFNSNLYNPESGSTAVNLFDLKEKTQDFFLSKDPFDRQNDDELFKLAIKFQLKNQKIIRHDKSWSLAIQNYTLNLGFFDHDYRCKSKLLFFRFI